MTKKFYIVLISILCGLCITSCDNRNPTPMILSVNTFNAPISCVSIAKDGRYYLGFENGDIARLEIKNNSRNIIQGKYIARIYDIVEENDTTLWVGIRDKGLVKMVRDSIVKNYSIGKNYAPYDICKNKRGDLFIGTSSGIYQLVNDSLVPILRDEYKEYKINQLCIYRDSLLYAATEKGVLKLSKKQVEDKYDVSLIGSVPEEIIFHFHQDQNQNFLYATTEKKVYEIKMETGEAKPVKTKAKDNLFAYFTETIDSNAHWELTTTQMNYWDQNGYSTFTIPGRLNRNYKNYVAILNDDFILLSFEYQLYAFSRHQNTKGESVHVIATHVHEEEQDPSNVILYFTTIDNYLYSCPIKKSGLVPKKMGKHKLEIDEVIIKLCSSHDYLWIITNNCLRQINRETGKLVATIEFGKGTDLKCMYVDKDTLLIGSRKWLFRIEIPKEGKITTESLDTIPTSIDSADVYVTDIYKHEVENLFYCATLNKGLCRLNSSDSLTPLPLITYEDVGNINKIEYIPNKGPYMYTSEGLFLEKSDSTIVNIPIMDYHNKYISTVLLQKIEGERLFIIGYKGIGMVKFKHKNTNNDTLIEAEKMAFFDMQFKNAAIAEYEKGKLLFLGDRTGLYQYNPENKAKLTPIKFPETMNVLNFIIGIIAIVVIVLIVFVYLYFPVKKAIKTSEAGIDTYGKKIHHHIRKENQPALLEKQTELKNEINAIKKIPIYRFRKRYLRIRKTKQAMMLWIQDIEENLLKREEIIEKNKILISQMLETIQKYTHLFDKDPQTEEKLTNIQSELEQISINSSYDKLDEITCIVKKFFNANVNIIEKNKNLISQMLESIQKYTHVFDKESLTEEKLKNIQSELEQISINSSYDKLDEITGIVKNLFDIIDQYLPKQYNELEKQMDEDLEEIEELVKNGCSYRELKEICNKFINKYRYIFLSKFKFMKKNQSKGFYTILICTNITNDDIDEILRPEWNQYASSFFNDLEKKCKKIETNYFIEKLLSCIQKRRREQKESNKENKKIEQ